MAAPCTSPARVLHVRTAADPSVCRGHPQKQVAGMNTPGKPKPSWRQRNVLMGALAAVVVIVLIILFVPW